MAFVDTKHPSAEVVADSLGNVLPRAASADIILLLEGTFPYVTGGVSSWVNEIIRAFPEYRFALCFLGSKPEDYARMAYALPGNVVHLECHYLHQPPPSLAVRPSQGDRAAFERAASLHDCMRQPERAGDANVLLKDILREMSTGGPLSEEQFLFSREAWELLTEQYRVHCTDPSFTDYFWTVRSMHRPLWQIARISSQLIPARVYHAISTGYAGFLGALLHHRHGRPLLLSEHGIYTKERKIDLMQSQWIHDNRSVAERDTQLGYFHELWIRFFESLGRLCYEAADDIVSLYEGNRSRQILDGAPSEKTRNVPNGVDIARFAPLRQARPAQVPKILCLVGRVVPIKDIKTFVRAMPTVLREMPDAQAWIAGPMDEDAAYAEEVLRLNAELGLNDKVRFLGVQKIDELLPKVGVLVLSSISEALPLSTLEGFAAGVPAVTTDVGACRQLIDGLDGEDAALGAAGRVVPVADPVALAQAALELLRDADAWRAAQAAAIARVERYYSRDQMTDAYRELYAKLVALPGRRPGTGGHGMAQAGAVCPHMERSGRNGER